MKRTLAFVALLSAVVIGAVFAVPPSSPTPALQPEWPNVSAGILEMGVGGVPTSSTTLSSSSLSGQIPAALLNGLNLVATTGTLSLGTGTLSLTSGTFNLGTGGSFTGAGTFASGGFTLTVPATGTAAIQGLTATFSAGTYSGILTAGNLVLTGTSLSATQTLSIGLAQYPTNTTTNSAPEPLTLSLSNTTGTGSGVLLNIYGPTASGTGSTGSSALGQLFTLSISNAGATSLNLGVNAVTDSGTLNVIGASTFGSVSVSGTLNLSGQTESISMTTVSLASNGSTAVKLQTNQLFLGYGGGLTLGDTVTTWLRSTNYAGEGMSFVALDGGWTGLGNNAYYWIQQGGNLRPTTWAYTSNGSSFLVGSAPINSWRWTPGTGLSIFETTASTNSSTGSLTSSGGIGIAGMGNFGGGIGTTSFSATGATTLSGITVMGNTIALKAYTVATLPTATTSAGFAGSTGAMATVTDAAAVPIYNAAATGGGSIVLPVMSTGTGWTNH